MKRIALVILAVVLSACSAIAPASATPTSTPFIVPALPSVTPAATRTPIVVSPTPTPEDLFYVVQPGDTLTSIAEEYGLTVEYLAGINSIPDINIIYVGDVLKLKGVIEIPFPSVNDGKQIIVKLSIQRVYAYEDGKLAHAPFLVSTGITQFPTRVGGYKIWVKLPSTTMSGGTGADSYYLPNVLWTMYFDEGRGFHGKYWNKIYGRPSSHGCVNMTDYDAKWLYDWAPLGTDVRVIP